MAVHSCLLHGGDAVQQTACRQLASVVQLGRVLRSSSAESVQRYGSITAEQDGHMLAGVSQHSRASPSCRRGSAARCPCTHETRHTRTIRHHSTCLYCSIRQTWAGSRQDSGPARGIASTAPPRRRSVVLPLARDAHRPTVLPRPWCPASPWYSSRPGLEGSAGAGCEEKSLSRTGWALVSVPTHGE